MTTEELEPTPAPPRSSVFPRVLAGVIIVGAVAVGIVVLVLFLYDDNSGSSTDVATYMTQVETLMVEISEESGAVEVQAPQAALPALSSVLRNKSEELDAIEPPGQAQDAHDALVLALSDGGDAILVLGEANEDIEDINAIPELLAGDPAVTEAGADATAACQELQAIADENNVDVTLSLCAPTAGTTSAP